MPNAPTRPGPTPKSAKGAEPPAIFPSALSRTVPGKVRRQFRWTARQRAQQDAAEKLSIIVSQLTAYKSWPELSLNPASYRTDRYTEEVVLDTNVVLDWLVFDDPAARALGLAIASGRWRWVGSPEMAAEVQNVLTRPGLDRWAHRVEHALTFVNTYCSMASAVEASPDWRLRSSDPDDQKFIDLSLARRVRYLFSRDKALLRLARRASSLGVTVLRPCDLPGDSP